MKYSELDIKKLNDNQIYDLVMSGAKDYSKIPVDEKTSPDLLIVLGATPIPMRARIAKALQLYKNGYGKYIILSGGTGWHKLFKVESTPFKNELERYTYYSGKQRNFRLMKRALQRTIPDEIKNKNKHGKALYRHMHRQILKNMDLTEAEVAKKIVNACRTIVDIDENKIFLENSSKNTRENIENSMKMMQELLKEGKVDDIKSVMIITSCFHCKRVEMQFKKYYPFINVKACPSTKDLEDNGISLERNSLTSNAYYKSQIRKELEGIIAYTKNGTIVDEEIKALDLEKEQNL